MPKYGPYTLGWKQFGQYGFRQAFGRRALGQGVGFSLDAFMSSQADGLFFDFTKTDRHFQQIIGPDLADDVSEPIGLALGQRPWNGQTYAQVVAAQPELRGTGVTVSVGTVTAASYDTNPGEGVGYRGGSAADMSGVKIPATNGKFYVLDIELTGGSNLTIRYGNVNGTSPGGSPTARTLYFIEAVSGSGIFISTNTNGGSVNFTLHSMKEVPGRRAEQGTGSLKGLRQTTGNKFDGTDDNMLTPYFAAAGANFIVASVDVPASLAGAQIILGASAAAGADRFYLGVTAGGALFGGCGADGSGTLAASNDIRSQALVVGMSFNGTTVDLYANDAAVFSKAQSGAPVTNVAARLGANNANGTAANFFGGSVKKLVVGREYLTLAKYQQIRNALLAA